MRSIPDDERKEGDLSQFNFSVGLPTSGDYSKTGEILKEFM